MMQKLRFVIVYTWHNFTRNKQRAVFALMSIAAGVATVTTLRILGLSLTDALTANAQAFLRSDILVAPGDSPLRIGSNSLDTNSPLFLPDDTQKLNDWAVHNEVEITYRLSGQLLQVTTVGDPQSQTSLAFGYFIEPQKYPFYDTIRAVGPRGVLLKDLFTGPHPVVIAQRIADDLNLHLGDRIQIGSVDAPFIVTGIVPDSAENYLDNPFRIAFSFVYLEYDRLPEFGIAAGTADRAYVKLPEGVDPEVFVDTLYNQWRALVPSLVNRSVRYDRISNILQRNQPVAGFVTRTILLFSLIALIIGGVGILNTMYVTVNHRTDEIAILKTIGLRRMDIALIFFVHALLLGIGGSLLGVVLGSLLSLVARRVGEYAFAIALPWHVTADPFVLGVALGVGVTIIFSFLPTQSATNVLPGLLLRQQEVVLTQASRRAIAVTALLLIMGLGLLIDQIFGVDLRNLVLMLTGIVLSAIGVGIFFIATLLMWCVVWVLGHLPTFGNPHLRLAIRGLSLHRGRTASALLALVIGMSSLSATLILSRSISVLAFSVVSQPLGGNVMIIPLLPLTQAAVHTQLAASSDVTAYYDVSVTQAELVAVDSNPFFRTQFQSEQQLSGNLYLSQLNSITGIRGYGQQDTSQLLSGRLLSEEDTGHDNLVVPYNLILVQLGVHVGSTFTYRFGTDLRTFTVVGIVRPSAQAGLIPFSISSNVTAPIDVIPQQSPFQVIVANVHPVAVAALTESLRRIPGVFVIDVDQFDSIVNRVLKQTAALPLLIAALSLFAASVLVATTVSLSTLERRREIGVLKSLGLKVGQVLWQLVLQNSLIGFVGGIISLLPTLIAVALVPVVSDEIIQLPLPIDLILLLLVLSTGITVIATLLTGWAAVHESPTAVLHYE